MLKRTPELQNFLSTLHQAVKLQAADSPQVQAVTGRIMDALEAPEPVSGQLPRSLPVCTLIDEVCDELSVAAGKRDLPTSIDGSVARHAQAMQALTQSLVWWRRPNADSANEPFASGHANAMLVGPRGLEQRSDVWVGVTVMAPNIEYPVHRHAPEEVYLVLSEGQWLQGESEWQEPGIGGVVHNPSNVLHAMRSGAGPLLATWCLWAG